MKKTLISFAVMSLRRAVVKKYLFILLVALNLMSYAAIADEGERDESGCLKDVYVTIGGHNLKLPGGSRFLYIEKDGVLGKNRCHESTPDQPIEADYVHFQFQIHLEGYKPLWPSVKLNSKNSENHQNKVYYEEMLTALKAQGKSLKDLPQIGGFYKYKYYEYSNSHRYFAIDRFMYDAAGFPFALQRCPDEKRPLLCSSVFNWKPKISIFLSLGGDQLSSEQPFKIWQKLYPTILKKLDGFEYQLQPTQENQGD